MELVLIYNQERFDKKNSGTDPITRDSVVQVYDFNPTKRYELKSVVTQALIEENRGLYETSQAEFYKLDVPASLSESNDPTAQSSYIAGSVGLTLDRILL